MKNKKEKLVLLARACEWKIKKKNWREHLARANDSESVRFLPKAIDVSG
jgi:hypothetical protein